VEETTKGESPVDEAPSPVETREDAERAERAKDDPRNAIYEKYDAMKAKESEEETAEEVTEEPPPVEASEPKVEEPKAAPAKEPEEEELTAEEFAERFKNVRIKGKFAGEEAVVGAKDLIRVQGLDRHLTKRLQEVARKEEALGAVRPPPVEYRPPTEQPTGDRPLRYWDENDVAQKYDEMFQESPYKAQQFLNTVQSERQRAQAENEKVRMETAERDFLALHSEMDPTDYESMKNSFADADFFRRNPDVDHAFQRKDYYGALELARVKLVEKKLNDQLSAIKAAQEAALADEQKRIELKKKGSVIRTASKPEAKQKEEFRELTPLEATRAEAKRRQRLRGLT